MTGALPPISRWSSKTKPWSSVPKLTRKAARRISAACRAPERGVNRGIGSPRRSARLRRLGFPEDDAPDHDRLEGSEIRDVVLSRGGNGFDGLQRLLSRLHLAEDREVAVVWLVRRE